MNEKSSYHRLPYTHEEIEQLFSKIAGKEALLAEDYEKLINVIGLDNISTFSGNYEDLKNLPDIPRHVSDLLNDLEYQTADEVNRKLTAVQENLITLINEYENDSELEYAKNTDLENAKEILEIMIDVRRDEIIKQVSSLLVNYATKSQLNRKADLEHNHQITDISGLESRIQTAENTVKNVFDQYSNVIKGQHNHDNHAVLNQITQKKYDEWNDFLRTTDEKILLKADMDHNHDDRYADKDDEHNHWNKDILDVINADTIENLNKRLFIAYHDGLDENGKYIKEEDMRDLNKYYPKYDGNVNGWYTLTGDPEKDVHVDVSKAVWMSHKIHTCIKEGVWSSPIKIVGQKLVGMKTQYYVSTSNEECINGEWLDNLPENIGDNYLWSRMVLIWENPDGVSYTAPVRQNLDSILRGVEEVKTEITNQINNITNEFNEHKTYVTDTFETKADATTAHNSLNTKFNNLSNSLNVKAAELENKIEEEIADLNIYISDTYQKKSAMSSYSTTDQMNSAITNESNAIKSHVAGAYQTKDAMSAYMTTEEILDKFQSTEGSIGSIASTYATKDELKNYYNKTETNNLINESKNDMTSYISSTYQTISNMSNYSTTAQVQNLITQSANNITSSVSNTYQTKSAMSSYSTTTQVQNLISSAISSHTHTAVNGITVSKTTQAAYDSATKNANTFYIIVG